MLWSALSAAHAGTCLGSALNAAQAGHAAPPGSLQLLRLRRGCCRSRRNRRHHPSSKTRRRTQRCPQKAGQTFWLPGWTLQASPKPAGSQCALLPASAKHLCLLQHRAGSPDPAACPAQHCVPWGLVEVAGLMLQPLWLVCCLFSLPSSQAYVRGTGLMLCASCSLPPV